MSAAAGGRPVNVVVILKEPEYSLMGFQRLADRFETVRVAAFTSVDEAALAALPDAEVLITIGHNLGAQAGEVYSRAKRLKWVQSIGTGVDNIKGHPALGGDVVVANVHGVHGPQLSEAAFTAMLSFARHVPDVLRNQAEAKWEKVSPVLLKGATACIIGLGAIANELAPRCKAFDMRVIGVTSTPRPMLHFDHIYARAEIADAMAETDYCIVLTPHTPDTHHMIDAAVLKAMKPGAILVDLSRGGVTDNAALLAALDDQLGGAALDVFETQPLPADSPFWTHPRVIVTSHNAGFHAGYPEQAYGIIESNLARYLEGGVDALSNKV